MTIRIFGIKHFANLVWLSFTVRKNTFSSKNKYQLTQITKNHRKTVFLVADRLYYKMRHSYPWVIFDFWRNFFKAFSIRRTLDMYIKLVISTRIYFFKECSSYGNLFSNLLFFYFNVLLEKTFLIII